MVTTLNQALEIAKTGNWNQAWEIAQQDEGMLPGTKKEAWIDFAKKALIRREEEAIANII